MSESINYTIATVNLERFAAIVKATTYHAIPPTYGQDDRRSCVHIQVLGQAMTIYGTDTMSASWGTMFVEAGDTPSFTLNSKRMLQAVRDLRMVARRDKAANVALSRIDDHFVLEAMGTRLHVEIYPPWNEWQWTTIQPNNDIIASCAINPKQLASIIKPHKNNRLCMTITRRDGVASSWIELKGITVSDEANTFRRTVNTSTIHTVGVNNVEDWTDETRDVWFYAERFAKTLMHAGSTAQLRIYRTWMSPKYGLLTVSNDAATHVVMPSKPVLEKWEQ